MSKRKNGLKWVQLSPILMRICKVKTTCQKKNTATSESQEQSNKGVNEENNNPEKNHKKKLNS